MHKIDISIALQLLVIKDESNNELAHYSISTAKNGAGEQMGSNRTPRGKHIVRAKIGRGCPENTVSKSQYSRAKAHLQKIIPIDR